MTISSSNTNHVPSPAPEIGSTEQRKKRRKKAAVFGFAGMLLVVGVAGSLVASGAYFTNTKTTPDNTITTGTIALGGLGDAGSTIAIGRNVMPIADGTEATEASVMTINIRNVGTAAFDWSAQFTTAKLNTTATVNGKTAPTDTLEKINVEVSSDGGSTWSGKTTLQNLPAQQFTSTESLAAPVGDVESVFPIMMRLWMDKSAGNNYQGVTATFSVTAKAIQSGIGFTDPDADWTN